MDDEKYKGSIRKVKIVVIIIGVILVLGISYVVAVSLVAKSYNVSDEIKSMQVDVNDEMLSQNGLGEGYEDIPADVVSKLDNGSVAIYGRDKDFWDVHKDIQEDRVHMQASYYESELYKIKSSDRYEEVLLRSNYILSTELSPYKDLLEEAIYSVDEGIDGYDRDMLLVSYKFENGLILIFEYCKTVSPTHIIKSSKFSEEEIEYFRWFTDYKNGIYGLAENDGLWVLGR